MGPACRGATEDNAEGEGESRVVGVKRERATWWERWQAKGVVESEGSTARERGGDTAKERHGVAWRWSGGPYVQQEC